MIRHGAGLLAVTPAPHGDILHALVGFGTLLAVARGLAELAGRLGRPP